LASKASSLISRGVLPVTILVEGKTPTDLATRSNLDAWIGRLPESYTGLLDSVDPQPKLEDFFSVPRDQFVIVDLKTMKFVDIYEADPNGAMAAVESMLPPVDGGM
jgi:hypothetical protein